MNNKERYGQVAFRDKSILLLTEIGISDSIQSCHGTKEGLSLDNLRTRLLTEHLKKVIECLR